MTKSQITAETTVFYLTFLIEGNAKFQLMIIENKTFLRPKFMSRFYRRAGGMGSCGGEGGSCGEGLL